MSQRWQFWIDRGGTFTDVVAQCPDGTLVTQKLLSASPQQYDDAAVEGIRRVLNVPAGETIPTQHIDTVRMGTTVATNALLERAGADTVLVTTAGLADVPRIGYQARPHIFARRIAQASLLHSKVIEATERLAADGTVLRDLDTSTISKQLQDAFSQGYRAVAVALIHSYRNPVHERAIGQLAERIGFSQISLSSETSGLMKLVPRIDTTVVDAYLSPLLRRYVDSVAAQLPDTRLLFMRSSGGLTSGERFHGKDAILSGPAGGIVGMARTAQAAGIDQVIGFDMGGTSTDVSRFAGEFERDFETEVAGVRLRSPMLSINTVAAGGGSILHFDGSRYRVGPDSAGAQPGPCSYRRGGPLTVTDANLMLGHIHPEFFPHVFGEHGTQPLDRQAVVAGFTALAARICDGRSAEQVAAGFRKIAVSNMADEIKRISVEKGHDVSQYTLATFGGAGGQHACSVADALSMTSILIHPHAGVLSAYGMGLADLTATAEQSLEVPLAKTAETALRHAFDELHAQTITELRDQGVPAATVSTIDRVHVKYAGTQTALPVKLADIPAMRTAFETLYQQRFSFLMPERDLVIESVSVEAVSTTARAETQLAEPPARNSELTASCQVPIYSDNWTNVDLHRREDLIAGDVIAGPCVIAESGGTTVVDTGWQATVTRLNHLLLNRVAVVPSVATDTKADPVMLELFNNVFMSIAEQMGNQLRASANSVNIKERLDFSCALFDHDGRLIANAPHIPVHLGSMGESIKAVINVHANAMRPGDSFVINNPYAGGTHLPDVTVVTPVFSQTDARVQFYVASRGHHAEIGGMSPGSMPAFSTNIEQEGVLIDNVLLASQGRLLTAEATDLLTTGRYPSRNPANNIADLRAQLAANTKGVAELHALVEQYGYKTVAAYMTHVRNNARDAIINVLGQLHNGEYCYEMDSGAVINVAVTIDPSRRGAHIDFTGTSPQQAGNFNAPSCVAMAAVLYTFRTLIDDEIPLNAGCLEPLRVTIPSGSMLAPQHPAAVVAGNVETSQAIVGALYAALGVQAEGAGTMNNIIFGNSRHQYYETVASGSGAGDGFDGTAVVQTHMTNSRLTDPEVLEWRFPVVLDEFSIRRGSGGAGQWHGGDGAVRRLRFTEAMTVTILASHRRIPPYGAAGGSSGDLGAQWVERADGSRHQLDGLDTIDVAIGDVFVLHTPGGGGYGMMSGNVRH